MTFKRRLQTSHQWWRNGRPNFPLRKKGVFVVWESIDLLLGTTSFKSIQWSRTGGAQKGKHITSQHCETSHWSHMICIRSPGLPVSSHLHRVKQGESTCQLPVEICDDKPQAVTPIWIREWWQDKVAGQRNWLHLFISIDVASRLREMNGANWKTNITLGGGHLRHTGEECQCLANAQGYYIASNSWAWELLLLLDLVWDLYKDNFFYPIDKQINTQTEV